MMTVDAYSKHVCMYLYRYYITFVHVKTSQFFTDSIQKFE